jgi:hypothetical protein
MCRAKLTIHRGRLHEAKLAEPLCAKERLRRVFFGINPAPKKDFPVRTLLQVNSARIALQLAEKLQILFCSDFDFVLKGRGFSRAVTASKSSRL